MKTYYPSYYKNFICIADKCPITCCQEWNIGVDDTTYDRWCHTAPPNDMPYLHKVLSDYTSLREHQHMITLDEEKNVLFYAKINSAVLFCITEMTFFLKRAQCFRANITISPPIQKPL